jgi:hypothetical protein
MRQSFGDDVDYAMLVKIFAASPESAKGKNARAPKFKLRHYLCSGRGKAVDKLWITRARIYNSCLFSIICLDERKLSMSSVER